MKHAVPILAAVAVGTTLLVRQALPGAGLRAGGPAAPAAGWVAATPPAHRGDVRPSPAPPALVYVAGAVRRPGVYRLAGDARVRDAVALSGGLRPDADPVAVNLAAHLRDGDEIVVPVLGAAAPPKRAATRPYQTRRVHGPRRHASPPAGLIDLNTADADMLATVPGIGAGLALRIVAFRESNGAFASPDELLDVAGITDRRLDAILPFVVAR